MNRFEKTLLYTAAILTSADVVSRVMNGTFGKQQAPQPPAATPPTMLASSPDSEKIHEGTVQSKGTSISLPSH
jgi:hypothetical protein